MSNGETLNVLEKEVLRQAKFFETAQTACRDAESATNKAVQSYQAERERLQREAWKKEDLGWCQWCNKFHPKESIQLLYTQGKEWHGSEGYETYAFYRRLRNFCGHCAEELLSRPRGGREEFQCFRADKSEEGFTIFVSGKWIPLADLKGVVVEIERGFIPEDEYRIGKNVEFYGWPVTRLLIEGKEVKD